METEYSNEIKGKIHAYRFEKWEMHAIASGLRFKIRQRKKRIKQIQDKIDNEGQATYQVMVEDIQAEIDSLNQIIIVFNEESKT